MLKKIAYLCFYICLVILIIPYTTFSIGNIFQIYNTEDTKKYEEFTESTDIINDLELFENSNYTEPDFEKNNLEEYIIGVVAAEMPISFQEEALKAQAVAARTYAYKRVGNTQKPIDYKSIGQAYNTIDEMKKKWGDNFDKYYNKVKNAVYSTKGIIMIYDNEPIEAVFHSTSAGVTEVSENIWGKNLPYIKSVDSKVDEKAPNFMYTTAISNSKIIEIIHKKYPKINKSKIISSFEIGERSKAGYVLNVNIDGQKISAGDIRSMFGLRSTNFTIEKTKDAIKFTTKGYGHGAGMSQYGANFMAQNGSTYEQILLHYYNGIILQKVY